MLWPPTYLSEGKILVESQQIPVDLVKPTVTTASKERIQVIEQRVMTRDNLLAILDKYLFSNDAFRFDPRTLRRLVYAEYGTFSNFGSVRTWSVLPTQRRSRFTGDFWLDQSLRTVYGGHRS